MRNFLNSLHAQAHGLCSPLRPACSRVRTNRKTSKLARATRHATVPPSVHSPSRNVDSADDDDVANALVAAVNGEPAIAINDTHVVLDELTARAVLRSELMWQQRRNQRARGSPLLPTNEAA